MKITWNELKELAQIMPMVYLHSTVKKIHDRLHEFPIDIETHWVARSNFTDYLIYHHGFSKTDVCTLMIIYDIESDDKLLAFLIKAICHSYHYGKNDRSVYHCPIDLINQMRDAIPKEIYHIAEWHHAMAEPFLSIALRDTDLLYRNTLKTEDKLRLILEKVTIDALLTLQEDEIFLSHLDKESLIKRIDPKSSTT